MKYLTSKNIYKNKKEDENDYEMYSLVLDKVIQLLVILKDKGEIDS
jgi:hypothetical protein